MPQAPISVSLIMSKSLSMSFISLPPLDRTLIVTAISNQEVKEAHKMILDASSKLDDVINEIMEKANA